MGILSRIPGVKLKPSSVLFLRVRLNLVSNYWASLYVHVRGTEIDSALQRFRWHQLLHADAVAVVRVVDKQVTYGERNGCLPLKVVHFLSPHHL